MRLTVNGHEQTESVEPRVTLADFLREDLSLTGTHIGCEHGACGACTVLLDGEPVRSCLIFAVQVQGSEIMTVEGLASDGQLNELQQALMDAHAFQCGFCAPGFLMQLTALLHEGATLDERSLREELSGNLCRCTGYESIIDGVLLALRRRSAGRVA